MHHQVCHSGCPPTPSRADLERNHGTPKQFAEAVNNAWDMVTPQEMAVAIKRYEEEWFNAKEDDQ